MTFKVVWSSAKKFDKKGKSDSSWLVSVEDLKNLDLSAKNPNSKGDIEHKHPKQILKSIKEKEAKIKLVLSDISKII